MIEVMIRHRGRCVNCLRPVRVGPSAHRHRRPLSLGHRDAQQGAQGRAPLRVPGDRTVQPLEEGDYFLYNKLESTIPDENPDEERVIERLSQNAVVEALAEVPHDFRDVIVLVDIGDFSYADAAQILEIPIGTVMSRLHRGRRILKRELAERAVGSSA